MSEKETGGKKKRESSVLECTGHFVLGCQRTLFCLKKFESPRSSLWCCLKSRIGHFPTPLYLCSLPSEFLILLNAFLPLFFFSCSSLSNRTFFFFNSDFIYHIYLVNFWFSVCCCVCGGGGGNLAHVLRNM